MNEEKQKTFFQLTQEKEIQSLEEEIEQLEALLHQRKELLNTHFEKKFAVDRAPKTEKDLEKICEDIKKQIELTTKLTGIVINELKHEPMKADNLTHYSLTGHCRNIRFRVEFDCLQHDNEDSQMTITHLDTYLPEYVTNEMNQHFLRTSEDRSLWGFFQLLVPYSEWEMHRTSIFNHFMEKYPDLVEIVKDNDVISYLKICYKKLKHSPVFCITWTFDVDQVCRAKPRLKLSVRVPDYINKQDKDDRLVESEARFDDMVEELGIEHAIDNLVRLLLSS